MLPPTSTSLPASSLADTSWILVLYGTPGILSTVPEGRTVTLNFRGLGGYDGNTGINSYGGQSSIEGNMLSIKAVTRTFFEDPLTDNYLELLRNAGTVDYKPAILIIYCTGNGELVFRPA